MDSRSFLSSAVQSLAWPTAAVIIAILFAGPIKRLIPLVRKLKWKELELDFAEKLEKAEEEAEAAELPPTPLVAVGAHEAANVGNERHYLIQLARVSPRAAIGEAWRQLEHDVREALKRKGIDAPANMMRMLEVASKNQLLPERVTGLVADLRGLRNQAVHGLDFEIDLPRAIEYIELVERVRAALPPKPVP